MCLFFIVYENYYLIFPNLLIFYILTYIVNLFIYNCISYIKKKILFYVLIFKKFYILTF